MNRLPYPSMSDLPAERQLTELRKYLFRLVEELNNTLGLLSSSQGIVVGSAGSESGKDLSDLKSQFQNYSKDVDNKFQEMSRSISTAKLILGGIPISSTTNVMDATPNQPSGWTESTEGVLTIIGGDPDTFYVLINTNGDLWTGYQSEDDETINWHLK